MVDASPHNEVSQAHRGYLKRLHLLGTTWFIVCVGFILILALRDAGFNWWVIFSLSGHSVVILFVLVSLYLFAIFRKGKQDTGYEIEHPLTHTFYYLVFYMSAPFLGGLAGLINGPFYAQSAFQFVYGVALGTFVTTFLVWVVLDPLIALIETYTPESRMHRAQRLARQRAIRQEKQRRRETLLQEVSMAEELHQGYWQANLQTQVQELATLLLTDRAGYRQAECRAVEIALVAWHMGGLPCMRYLHQQALSAFSRQHPDKPVADYIVNWWDGVGAWRNPDAG